MDALRYGNVDSGYSCPLVCFLTARNNTVKGFLTVRTWTLQIAFSHS